MDQGDDDSNCYFMEEDMFIGKCEEVGDFTSDSISDSVVSYAYNICFIF